MIWALDGKHLFYTHIVWNKGPQLNQLKVENGEVKILIPVGEANRIELIDVRGNAVIYSQQNRDGKTALRSLTIP